MKPPLAAACALLASAAAAARLGPSEPLRAVEVGGFLGDCCLWLAAWLGPERTRALEVEPVHAGVSSFGFGVQASA